MEERVNKRDNPNIRIVEGLQVEAEIDGVLYWSSRSMIPFNFKGHY